jgi:hypothetical protein
LAAGGGDRRRDGAKLGIDDADMVVQAGEAMGQAGGAAMRHRYTRCGEPACIGLAFVSQHVVFGGDDQGPAAGWRDLVP